ncbi:MAG: T9SS C-terminal target domain-containing protein, partial [Calditrichaeota bacterium]
PGQVFTINPRDTFDLEILTNPPVISDVVRNPGVPTSSDNVTVSATIVDNVSVASATLHYSVDWNPFQQVPMSANQDTFSAVIPAQNDGSFVRYFIEATDNVGDTSTLPGDTSQASGSVFFYVVRDAGLTIMDVQYTHGYASDASGYEGYEVTLQGVVMTDSTDEFGDFWIQDAAAPWSGIWVNNSPNAHVKGDLVSVTGTVEENFTVTRINNVTQTSVVTAGVGEYPPVDVTTGEVTTGGANAEAYEGVLIRLQNLTVTDPFPDGWPGFGEFVVDDGSGGVRIDDFFDAFDGQSSDTTYHQGDHIEFIRGFGYFSFGNAKVIPRDSMDVGTVTDIVDDTPLLPEDFVLEQNFPNPFNPSTDIRYSVPFAGEYRLEIYNVLGQKVRVLTDGYQAAGIHQVKWDGRDDAGQIVTSGIYFYRLIGKNVNLTRKMILLK